MVFFVIINYFNLRYLQLLQVTFGYYMLFLVTINYFNLDYLQLL
jgi:hypothetical protein